MRIERGAVIADRYVVSAIERPWLADRPEAGVVCLALDAILDDPVILYAADRELAGDLVDTGRRLALINDPRVPAVLDVGEGETQDGEPVAYVVCERTAAISLAEILSSGPIDSAPTRAIAGEVSEVLVHAARRGLHHRCLGPESIGITVDGDVVVHGIAIDAALSEAALGLEPQSGSTALREDALAVVDVLYACLSGMWPKPESRAGLPAAPRKNTRVVDVETLRSDLPEDLFTFVTGVTSRTDPGPRSPGEIIRYLRDWDRDSLTSLQGSPLPDEALFKAQDEGHTAASAQSPDTAAPASAHDSDRTGDASQQAGTDAADGSGATADGQDRRTGDTAGPGPAAGTDGTPAGGEDSTSRASTSAGSGVVGAKPTSNTAAGSATGGARGDRARSTTGMSAEGARPTASVPKRPEPQAPTAKRSATPDQIQAALSRIGMTRPGTSGYSAGRADGVRTKLDEQMQMRKASVFPLSANQISESETAEWQPEDTIEEYSHLSAQEYDRNLTAPIVDRDKLFTEELETQQMPVVTEADLAAGGTDGAAADAHADGPETDGTSGAATETAGTGPEDGSGSDDGGSADDGSWFLGGMFTTREEEIAEQRAAFERERARERRLNEEARERALAAERRRQRHRAASAVAAGRTTSVQAQPVDPAQAEERPSQSAPAESARPPSGSAAAPRNPAPSGTAGASQASAPAKPQGAPSRPASGGTSSAAPGVGPAAASPAGARKGGAASAGPAPAASAAGSGASAPARRRVARIWTVIGIVLLLAAVGFGLIQLIGPGDDDEQNAQPEPAAQPTQTAPETEEPEPEPEGPAPVVDSVSDLDPEGDGSENPDMVDNVLPGQDGHWQTDRYNSAQFGNLKSGLGLVFALEEESLVSAVSIDSPDSGSTVEIRIGDSDSPEDAETVDTAELDGDAITIEFDEPLTTSHVFVWYTELPAAGEGYRGQLDEVDIE